MCIRLPQFCVESPHTSRMWVENDPAKVRPPVAMVSFYPRMPPKPVTSVSKVCYRSCCA